MLRRLYFGPMIGALALMTLTACSVLRPESAPDDQPQSQSVDTSHPDYVDEENTIWQLFGQRDPETKVQVNKYIWAATLDVLGFLPITSVDPFTGVILTGYGTPPGGGRAYRATVLINDPALDARSLNLALQTRSGPVADATVRAVEDAILSRARQLRIADNKF
jgi:hypothetical protein